MSFYLQIKETKLGYYVHNLILLSYSYPWIAPRVECGFGIYILPFFPWVLLEERSLRKNPFWCSCWSETCGVEVVVDLCWRRNERKNINLKSIYLPLILLWSSEALLCEVYIIPWNIRSTKYVKYEVWSIRSTKYMKYEVRSKWSTKYEV